MDVKELSKLLTESATRTDQSKFIPWWEDDFENCIYRYDIFSEDTVAEIQSCLAQCPKETVLVPTGVYGGYGLTLLHLLVWHNFYDAVKAMFDDGRLADGDVNVTDDKGYGLTPFCWPAVGAIWPWLSCYWSMGRTFPSPTSGEERLSFPGISSV